MSTRLSVVSEGREPFAPHASGRGPFSRFELMLRANSAGILAQAGGSGLRTEQVSALAAMVGIFSHYIRCTNNWTASSAKQREWEWAEMQQKPPGGRFTA